jgi:hypothetical protein
MRYLKKQVLVDAYRFDGSYTCMRGIEVILGDKFNKGILKTISCSFDKDKNVVYHWEIAVYSGVGHYKGFAVEPGDWVVIDVDGDGDMELHKEIRVCKNVEFQKLYVKCD